MDYDRLRELQEKFEENPRRYFAPLANEYRKGGQPKRAIEICRVQLAQMPGHMSGQIVYGQSLYEVGEFDEARQVFERALTPIPRISSRCARSATCPCRVEIPPKRETGTRDCSTPIRKTPQ